MGVMFVYIGGIVFPPISRHTKEQPAASTKALHGPRQDFLTTVEKEIRDKEKWERTSETPASTVIPTTRDEDGQAGCFYFSRPSVGTTLVCMAHS